MKNSKADLILHPVRSRVVQTLIGGRQLTTQQIMELLSDIPQATLYRHINKLLEGGVVEVVDESQVRGTIEKVFGLADNGGSVPKKDFSNFTKEEHLQYFTAFLATIQSGFERYLHQDEVDLEVDGVGYRQVSLFLSDAEFKEFTQKIAALFTEVIENKPSDNRHRRTVSTIIVPDPKK